MVIVLGVFDQTLKAYQGLTLTGVFSAVIKAVK